MSSEFRDRPSRPSSLPDSVRTTAGAVFLVAGVLLLGVSALGDAGWLGGTAAQPPREWESFEPELAQEARGLADLRRVALEGLPRAARGNDLRTVEALHDVVTRRFTHGWARHTPATNWILWALGALHPGFGHVYDAGTLASRSRSLLCDQAAVVLAELARESGFRARMAGLTGHVAIEIWADGDWRYLDPDLEVTGRISEDVFLDLSRLSRRPDVVRSLYAEERSAAAPVLLSREDNYTVAHPERLDWKSSVLARGERVAGLLKYLVPVALLLVGGGLVRSRTGTAASAHGAPSEPARAMARKRGLESRSSS